MPKQSPDINNMETWTDAQLEQYIAAQKASVKDKASAISIRSLADTGTDFFKGVTERGLPEAGIALAGIPGDLESAGHWLGSKAGAGSILPDPQFPTSGEIGENVEKRFGPLYEPKGMAGQFGASLGQNLPSLAFPGGPAARVAGVAMPAIGGFLGEQAAGPVGGSIGTLAGGVMGARGLPATARPEYAANAGILAARGIPLSAGETTGNKMLKALEDAAGSFPWSGGRRQAMKEAQGRAFTGEVMKTMGAPGGLATADAVETAKQSLGNTFGALSTRNTLTADPQFVRDLTDAAQRYVNKVIPSQRAQGRQDVETIMLDIVQQMQPQGGRMSGKMYQDTRSRLGAMADGLRGKDNALAQAIDDTKKALDDAMMRSISPQDRAAWTEARKQWRNWKAIESSLKSGGENVAEGYISPPSFNRAVQGQGRAAQDPTQQLARAGSNVLTPLRSSGTGERVAAMSLLGGLGGAAGFAGDQSAEGILKGAAIGMSPSVLGRGLLSNPVQKYFRGAKLSPAEMRNRLLFQQLLETAEERQ